MALSSMRYAIMAAVVLVWGEEADQEVEVLLTVSGRGCAEECLVSSTRVEGDCLEY
jgi:hypothetical protein